jgi:hypothetical protein
MSQFGFKRSGSLALSGCFDSDNEDEEQQDFDKSSNLQEVKVRFR